MPYAKATKPLDYLQTTSRGATQARGRARRAQLMEAARKLLASHSLDQIRIADVAERADIPVSSTYHLFGDIADLWKDLARSLATAQANQELDLSQVENWQQLIWESLNHHRLAFNQNPAARKLMLGPHTPPDIKSAGCKEDFRFGTALWRVVRSQFVLPELADNREIFFKALLIADVFFSLSVAESDQVSEKALDEAHAAMIAYLGLFLPPQLARSEPTGNA